MENDKKETEDKNKSIKKINVKIHAEVSEI